SPSFLVPAVAALQAPENRSSELRKRQQQNPETLRRIGEHPRSTRLSSPTLSISQLRARFDPEGGRASSSYRFAKTSHCWSCVVGFAILHVARTPSPSSANTQSPARRGR